DGDPKTPLEPPVLREWVSQARGYIRASDAFLISDYGYGAATPEIFENTRARAQNSGVPVTLDSRYRPLAYSGVTAATPNESELEEPWRTRLGPDNDPLLATPKPL